MSNFVNLMDVIYPVNSVYISVSNTSPAASIGGTWSCINDKFYPAALKAIGIGQQMTLQSLTILNI